MPAFGKGSDLRAPTLLGMGWSDKGVGVRLRSSVIEEYVGTGVTFAGMYAALSAALDEFLIRDTILCCAARVHSDVETRL